MARSTRCGRRKSKDEFALKELIVEIHQKYKMYGYLRVKEVLIERGFLFNHEKVYRLMCELQIQSVIRKKRHTHTGTPSRIFDNLLERQFQGRALNEAFVIDITFISTPDGFRYLSVIKDLYNNEIAAWKVSKRNVYEAVLHSD
ncbi:IS3 family transposase [Viridibacillus sp. YIM B01967]|uniref:IS3 family transposase n=1 Tax=Viridibacillus soli TaxID=2798301 RepID=A0ABS1H857_9BACL|nr:IS3 family transposase [Viridibacillus soli]MBK3495581.1 IS3 family transposase [Viridibacillus soli]